MPNTLREGGLALGASKAQTVVTVIIPAAMQGIVTGIMLYFLNPNYIMMLFTDATGKEFFSAAVISLILGMLAIRAIIKSVLP